MTIVLEIDDDLVVFYKRASTDVLEAPFSQKTRVENIPAMPWPAYYEHILLKTIFVTNLNNSYGVINLKAVLKQRYGGIHFRTYTVEEKIGKESVSPEKKDPTIPLLRRYFQTPISDERSKGWPSDKDFMRHEFNLREL